MNVVTRGIRNALRSPVRSGAIVLMLAISIGLIVSMLVARSGVQAKIDEVKATNATNVTIAAAGVRGGMGGGDPLTATEISKITNTSHVVGVVSSLTDQLGTDETNLTSSIELGSFGMRQQRFESSGGDETMTPPAGGEGDDSSMPAAPTPRTTVTGTTDPNSVATDGSALTLTSGTTIDGTSENYEALLGTTLATKNNLKVGDTFTAYSKTFTVKGIFKTDNVFQDSGLIVPLKTLQTATDQAGAVVSVTATVDSSDNVASTVTALKTALGDKADITSQAEQASSTVSSLQSISSLATGGVIGATIAGAVIVLLAMTMIVRERRREIGVIKAIGGTNTKVIVQFITEALTLTVIGGLVGFAFGVLVSGPMTKSLVTSSSSSSNDGPRGIRSGGPSQIFRNGPMQLQNNIQDVTGSVSPAVLAGAAGMTLIIAIVGSAVPAWLIARVRPAEVLRTE